MALSKAAVNWVLKPLSHLSFASLYFLSDILYYLIRYVVRYRKKVVLNNLRKSFPEKSEAELKKTMNEFYRHFCDLIVETLKVGGMTEEQARIRCPVINPELINSFYEKGRSVILIAGHYANWELGAVVQPLFLRHRPLGIYSPLRQKAMDEYIRETREKFGMELIPKNQIAKKILSLYQKTPIITFFLSDQCPKRSQNAYWTTFLNRETGIPYGAGVYAVKYDMPVIYGRVVKIKRGHYRAGYELITDNPRELGAEGILEKYNQLLQSQIVENPPYWLWTHKRWKRSKNA